MKYKPSVAIGNPPEWDSFVYCISSSFGLFSYNISGCTKSEGGLGLGLTISSSGT